MGIHNDAVISGFDDLTKELQQYIDAACKENVTKTLRTGAKEFVADLLKLPKPRSKVNKSGYTHLIDTFTYKMLKNEVEIGWGKYYGPMLEKGAINMKSKHPHLRPTFDKNKDKYFTKMIMTLKGE